MVIIIACWIFIFFVVFLIGKLFLNRKIVSLLKIGQRFEWYDYFWFGLFIVFGILQIWSLILPVNEYSLLFMVLLATLSLLNILRHGIKFPTNINFFFIIFCAIGLFVISYYATQGPYWSDTVGYHLNAVKWANLYPVVPGLANLHSRLGFNTSFFPFAAMLNNWFMRDRVSHLALSFLVATLFVEFVWILLKSKNRNLKFFCILVVPAIVGKVSSSEMVASLYYDFALIIFILAASIEFIEGNIGSLFVSLMLSLLIFTTKLSGAFFSFLIIALVFFRLFSANNYVFRKFLLGFLIAGLFLLVPYFIRNVVLSGWLLYPLPFLNLNFDWTVPASRVSRLNTVIQTWAKVPGTEWSKYINSSFWDWFPIWYTRNVENLILMFFAFALGMISFLIIPIKKLRNFLSNNTFWLGIASLFSFLYVLFTAPDLRFGGIFIWTFFASIVSLYLSILKWDRNTKILIVLLAMVFVFKYSWPPRIDTEPLLKSIRWDQPSPTKNVNGILMPIDDGCGNSDLPCTPENNNIKWRVPGDLSKGFAPVK